MEGSSPLCVAVINEGLGLVSSFMAEPDRDT